MTTDYDVAIIGGGPAGLSAGIWLSRYLHSAAIVDSGDPRNWETRCINGYLGEPQIAPPELRRRGRAECERYGAALIDATASDVRHVNNDRFDVTLEDGPSLSARRILLAIGVKDYWPKIPGLERCYGITAHVCPDCDGYDTRGRKAVVIGSGKKAVGMALALTTWTSDIVICTNAEPPDMTAEHLEKLKKLNIPVIEARITCARSTGGEVTGLDFDGGMCLDCDQIFFTLGQTPADDLGAKLGCERDDIGRIITDERSHTSVRNVFAAGDIVHGPQLAIAAAAGGAIAALAIHHSLLPESRKL